ncbi:MAG: hypothetical protein Q9M94_06965 [Candidatus Gracilibacteria bacterium]|nr:hypothetical protein [Candidatus Gracilibacteria bacterium]
MALGFVTLIRSLVFIMLPLIVFLVIYFIVVYGENMPNESGIEMVIFTGLYMLGYSCLQIKYWKNLIKKIEKKSEK